MNDATNWLIVGLSILGSLLLSCIISHLIVQDLLEPYKDIQEECVKLRQEIEDITIQQNTYHIKIVKDTVIVPVKCTK